MLRLGVRLGWLASRNRDSGKARSRVFRFAERAYGRVGQHQRHLARGQAVCVAAETSTRLAQDRQLMAIQNCCRSFLAQR